MVLLVIVSYENILIKTEWREYMTRPDDGPSDPTNPKGPTQKLYTKNWILPDPIIFWVGLGAKEKNRRFLLIRPIRRMIRSIHDMFKWTFLIIVCCFLAGVYIVVFFVAKCAKHLLAFRNTASVQISLFIWIGALYLNDQTVDSLRGRFQYTYVRKPISSASDG